MTRANLGQLLIGTRGYFLSQMEGLSEDQLSAVPDKIGHNILWNMGHVVHSLYGMSYTPSGLDYPAPKNYPEFFKGGSSPDTWSEKPDIAEVLGYLKTSAKQVADDLAAGKFDSFKEIDLGQIKFATVEEALGFHLYHEGIHMGMCMEIKKLV